MMEMRKNKQKDYEALKRITLSSVIEEQWEPKTRPPPELPPTKVLLLSLFQPR